MKEETKCFLYILKSEFDVIKIGISANVENRMRSISTSTPGKITLVHSVEFETREKALAIEKLLHQRYAHSLSSGEWFRVNARTVMEDLNFALKFSEVMGASSYAHRAPASDFRKISQDDSEIIVAAVKLINKTGKASVSMLQRRLRIGYSRAARIFDELERIGALSEMGFYKDGARGYVRKPWD